MNNLVSTAAVLAWFALAAVCLALLRTAEVGQAVTSIERMEGSVSFDSHSIQGPRSVSFFSSSTRRTKLSDKDLEALVPSFRTFSRLSYINLRDTNISDDGLEALREVPGVMAISVRGTNISDEFITALAEMKQLKWIDVRETRVSAEGVETLLRKRPSHDCGR
jgi:hypothetical protein